LTSLLQGTLVGSLGSGVLISRLSQGLGMGLAAMLLGARAFGTVTGAPIPPGMASVGVTTSTVV
jgi:hypothetical protein